MNLRQMTLSALSAITLVSGSAFALGLGINLGPFELGVDAGVYGPDEGVYRGNDGVRVVPVRATFEDPICYAIRNQNLIELTVGFEDQLSANERSFTLKRITVEPYLLGRNKEGQPILRGNVVSEKVIRSVTFKDGDDVDANAAPEEKKAGWFSGIFNSRSKETTTTGVSTLKLRRVTDIRVVEQSHFDAPKDYGSVFKDDVYQVICSLPNSSAK